MLLTSVWVVVLGATPHLASVGFQAAGVDDKTSQFLSSSFATSLAEASGLRVMTNEELAAVLGIERQKQLLGCGEESRTCLAEIAAGLGAPGVVLGSVAIVGSRWAVTVKVIAAKDAQVLAARTGDLGKDANVVEWLQETARLIGPGLRKTLAPELPPLEASAGTARRLSWIPAAGAATVALIGVALFVAASSDLERLRGGDPTVTTTGQLAARLDGGRALQGFAWACWGVAAAGLATSVVMFFVGAPAALSAWTTGDAGGVVAGGTW